MTVDLTGVATSFIAAAVSVLAIVLPAIINSRMKDKQAAVVLGNAVRNSLGALVQTTSLMPTVKVTIPGVPAALQAPTQYVLDHASDEVAWIGISPVAIADKIDKQIGLLKISKAPEAVS